MRFHSSSIFSIACIYWLQLGCSAVIERPPAGRARSLDENAATEQEDDGGEVTDSAPDDVPADSTPDDVPAAAGHDGTSEHEDDHDQPVKEEWQPGDGSYAPGAECKTVSETLAPDVNYDDTALRAEGPISALRIDLLPEWPLEAVQPAFERIRDERFLCDPSRPDFPRRLTWLDPRRGCEMRAELVSWKLAEWGYPRPFKIFLAGHMQASTPNTPSGVVGWDWHVAAAVRVGDRAYVFDAALEPLRPLTLDEWVHRLVNDVDDLQGAVCDDAAFEPGSACFGGPAWATSNAIAFQQSTFEAEWKLQVALGRDPERTLGDHPPWAL